MQNASDILISQLQNNIMQLQTQNRDFEEKVQVYEEKAQVADERIKYLEFQIEQLKRLIHGSKRERFISNAAVNQLTLPFELEDSPVAEKAPESQQITYTREKTKCSNHPGRCEFPSHLPVVDVFIEPEESTEGMVCIGEEITSELELDPGRLFVRKIHRKKYALPNGEGILIGKLPVRPIEKGIPGAGLLANIAVEKFVDHLPIYRQIERFKREDIKITDSTIDNWITKTAELLDPLYEYLKRLVLGQGYLQVDETPIKVLDRDKKGTTHQGYYWVYHSPLQNAVFFDYQPGRGRAGPAQMLNHFKGYLQTDGYAVYDWFAQKQGITHVGCMAHARRNFEKALSYDAEKAGLVLQKIQQVYAIERKAREQSLSPEQRKELRLNESLPILNELGKTLAMMNKTAAPRSPMGLALEYMIKRWDILLSYLYDGSLEIDNNLVENAIRPNAIGRKNCLFAGSHNGARRSAIFYSFFGTCKKHNINPWQWLKKVLEIIPEYPANKLADLLPQNMKL